MIRDIEFDELILPFLNRQQALEHQIVMLIAKRVKEIGTMLPSDIHKLERLYKTGSDVKAINKAIAEITGLQVKQIKKMIKEVAAGVYQDAKPFYDYRHKSFIPFQKNSALNRVIEAVSRQTQKAFKNLSNSQMVGFMIRDRKHPGKLKFYDAEDAYKSIIDEAIQAAQSGTVDYNTMMRKTLRQLTNSGMRRIYWDSGYSQRMDTAVKRNILDGIKQISQQVHNITGEEFGADGFEITAHPYPAPDHAPFQGHLLTMGEFYALQDHKPFQDVKGNKFPAQERILGQWNCRHMAYPVILEATIPTYTDEQLQDILKRNSKGVTLSNGQHLTGYQALQMQNKLALKVRQMKDAQMMAQEAGDMQLAKEYQIKVNKAVKAYNAYNKYIMSQITISERRDKLTVSGYKRISTK